jgi:hypothetical protein
LAGERYYLRLLLTVVRDSQSFEELYEVDGVRFDSSLAACIARGLADNDEEWLRYFEGSPDVCNSHGFTGDVRHGVAHVVDPRPASLWNRFKDNFTDALAHRLQACTSPI